MKGVSIDLSAKTMEVSVEDIVVNDGPLVGDSSCLKHKLHEDPYGSCPVCFKQFNPHI